MAYGEILVHLLPDWFYPIRGVAWLSAASVQFSCRANSSSCSSNLEPLRCGIVRKCENPLAKRVSLHSLRASADDYCTLVVSRSNAISYSWNTKLISKRAVRRHGYAASTLLLTH